MPSSANSDSDPIVIVSAARTPLGNFQGSLKQVSATELGAVAIKAVVERAEINPNNIQSVLMGCVLPAGLGQAPARQAAVYAGLPYSTSCVTLNKVCGSAMQAIMFAHDMLIANSFDVIIAGGMESMTNAPYLLAKARAGYRLGHGQLIDHMFYDGLEDAYQKGELMGKFAETCAAKYHFSRTEQDNFALNSLERAKNATEQGIFNAEIAPVPVKASENHHKESGEILVFQDDGPVFAKPEKISMLKPAFATHGTITAANSSSISDGAAAVLLMRQSEANKRNLTPLAKIIAHSTYSHEPSWFATAPIGAIKLLLAKTGWSVQDVDLFEINEAFAVVVMAALQELQLPPEKVNIHGGATVLGHPIGASGARIIVTLLYALRRYGLKRGIASLCIGGGEATAIALEML